jgi:DNA-directed RNA polymerase sigma subunit (sigma70/sigma32)
VNGYGNRPRKDAYIDDRTPYERDFKARVFVSMYPNGATLEAVAAMFDVTRERIRQIEASAITRLTAACGELDVSLEALLGGSYDEGARDIPVEL